MSTISRYLLKEHAVPFLLGLALILFVLLLDVILRMLDQVLSRGLTAWLAIQLLFYNLAWIIALAVPMAVLIAVLMAFSRLAADGEILATKACGLSFVQLLRPVLAAAGVLTILMVLFNDLVLPDWNHRARVLATDLRRRKAALSLRGMEGLVMHGLGDYSLLFRRLDEEANLLYGITVYDTHGAAPPTTLHAPVGQIELLDGGAYMRLVLNDAELIRFDTEDQSRMLRASSGRQVIHIHDPARAFSPGHSTYRTDREMSIGAMRAAVERQVTEKQHSIAAMDSLIDNLLHTMENGAAAENAGNLNAGNLDNTLTRTRSEVQRHMRLNENRILRINQYRVEIHKKYAIPVACLVFVLVGAPLGIIIRRRGVAVSIGVSMGFFWLYWIFLIAGEELGDRGIIEPALSMWAPNLVFGLLGLHLTRATALDRPWLRWPGRGGWLRWLRRGRKPEDWRRPEDGRRPAQGSQPEHWRRPEDGRPKHGSQPEDLYRPEHGSRTEDGSRPDPGNSFEQGSQP